MQLYKQEPILQVHTAIQQFMTIIKSYRSFVNFEADALRLKQSDTVNFENINDSCKIQMDNLIAALKNDNEWALSGKNYLSILFIN